MTKEDYIKIAEILKKVYQKREFYSSGQLHAIIVSEFEEMLKSDNSGTFDRDKFIEAVYGKD